MANRFRVTDANGVRYTFDNYIEAVNESMKIKAAHFKETGEKRNFLVEVINAKGGNH